MIPQVSTVCPVRTRTPGLRSAQGAMASARGPTRKKRPEGRALRARRPPVTQGLADPGGGRGRRGLERLPIGQRLQPNKPSSQQVPGEAEGGAGARAAGNSPNPPPAPTSQVSFESRVVARLHPILLDFHHPPKFHSLMQACGSLGASNLQVLCLQVAELCPVERCDEQDLEGGRSRPLVPLSDTLFVVRCCKWVRAEWRSLVSIL